MSVGKNELCLKDKLQKLEPLKAIRLVVQLEEEVTRIIRERPLRSAAESVTPDTLLE